MKNIFVLYTGGTIGMSQSSLGLRPDTALAGKALTGFRGLNFDWHICRPLIDSSALTTRNWQQWLQLLAEKIPQYDGVLVLHGTDTMAYTANLLALALQGAGKPVVLTGAQWPYDASGSDAPHNLAAAAAAFGLAGLHETVIAFNGKLFPAVGSSKTSTETADGFSNPHFGTLAQWQPEQGWFNVRLKPRPAEQNLRVRPFDPQAKVVCATLTPGFAAQAFSDGLFNGSADAVILQSYGHGNAPSEPQFIEAVRRFTAQGGLVLNISQVPHGNAAAVYAQGSALRQAGAVDGGKTNLETAAALLTLAVSDGWQTGRLQQELAALGLT